MRSHIFLIRVISVFAIALMITASAFAQGKGRGGGGGGGNRGGGPPGQERRGGGGGQPGGGGQIRQPQPQAQPQQQRHMGGGGGWQQQRPQRQTGGGGGWQQQQEQRQQQMNAQREQMRQWQQVQRQQVQRQQQVNAQRQQMRQWQEPQRPQFQRQQQVNSQRDQMRQWQNAQRQQRDLMRQQQAQQRQWQRPEREQRQWQRPEREQRVQARPDQNWGPVRRQQGFDERQYRDQFRGQNRGNRDGLNFARRQQRLDNRALPRVDRDYFRGLRRDQQFGGERSDRDYFRRDQQLGDNVYRSPEWQSDWRYNSTPNWNYDQSYSPTYYNTRIVNVWYGDDYSDYNRFRVYNVYTPAYTVYDYAYPDTFPLYTTYYYDQPYYGYNNGGFDWKTLLFRSVIAAFFSNGDNIGYMDPYPRYSYYSNDGYYGYIPAYTYQQPYYTFGYEPTYAYYEPAAYYGYDQYADYGVPYDYIGYPSFPYNDMVTLYEGGLGAELIQRALSTGYYQGLMEGQLARQRGWDYEQYYSDPYLYDQTMYDPYSSSIGDCRRHFSEGYEMGYADGYRNHDEFYVAQGGDIDLVSVLVGDAINFRS